MKRRLRAVFESFAAVRIRRRAADRKRADDDRNIPEQFGRFQLPEHAETRLLVARKSEVEKDKVGVELCNRSLDLLIKERLDRDGL